MNSKQLKAQRRRAHQKQKKHSTFVPHEQLELESLIIPSPSLLNRKIEFDQLALGPGGVLLKPVQGVIIKVEVEKSHDTSIVNNEIFTISLLNTPKKINKRAQALLGNDNYILRLPRSELFNFRFIT